MKLLTVRKRFNAEVTNVILFLIILSFFGFLFYSGGVNQNIANWPSPLSENDTNAGAISGWNSIRTSNWDLVGIVVESLTSPSGVLGSILILGTLVNPNPYTLFAGFVFFLSGVASSIIIVVLSASGFPQEVTQFIPFIFIVITTLGLVSWWRGGATP